VLLSGLDDSGPEHIFRNAEAQKRDFNFGQRTVETSSTTSPPRISRRRVADRRMWGEDAYMNPTDLLDVSGYTYTYS